MSPGSLEGSSISPGCLGSWPRNAMSPSSCLSPDLSPAAATPEVCRGAAEVSFGNLSECGLSLMGHGRTSPAVLRMKVREIAMPLESVETELSWGREWAEWATQWQDVEAVPESLDESFAEFQRRTEALPQQLTPGAGWLSGSPQVFPSDSLCIDDSVNMSFRMGKPSGFECKLQDTSDSDLAPSFQQETMWDRFPSVFECGQPLTDDRAAKAIDLEEVCVAVLGRDGSKKVYAPPHTMGRHLQEEPLRASFRELPGLHVQGPAPQRRGGSQTAPTPAVVATLQTPVRAAAAATLPRAVRMGYQAPLIKHRIVAPTQCEGALPPRLAPRRCCHGVASPPMGGLRHVLSVPSLHQITSPRISPRKVQPQLAFETCRGWATLGA